MRTIELNQKERALPWVQRVKRENVGKLRATSESSEDSPQASSAPTHSSAMRS